ncbi:MAG: glutamate--cysteine ligase, partial [Lentilactobacillus parabuchneri]|nr:glutamate--cysteine ligase [Lentilactobacillus parabuchneri]
MFDKIGQIIFNNEIVANASDFNMGIEVETIRIDSAGRLTKEPSPKALGNQRKNHFIKTDVYQIQSEIITPTARKSLDAMHYLMALNDTLLNALEPNELLWPLSMPPVLPQDKSTIPIADVDPEQKAYYEKWIKTRSDTQGIPVGVHLNVSINDDVLKTVWQSVDDQYDSYADFVNYIYIK